MEEAVDDLSPICRETAFIGLDRDGNLSLFDGPPRKEKVIRTFFQLDVKSLESSLSKERMRELTEGIRVTNRDSYNHVLTRYVEYARDRAQGSLKRAE
nr:BofC C-terminal domain-containing protein [Cohnella sp. REN36]